jgi:hypothetical protein
MPFIDFQHGDPVPKRGDLVQSNVGSGRERTWLILRVRRIRRKGIDERPRYQVWMARWWEIDADFRLRLFRSAERNSGQRVVEFHRYPAKRRRTFEDYLCRDIED